MSRSDAPPPSASAQPATTSGILGPRAPNNAAGERRDHNDQCPDREQAQSGRERRHATHVLQVLGGHEEESAEPAQGEERHQDRRAERHAAEQAQLQQRVDAARFVTEDAQPAEDGGGEQAEDERRGPARFPGARRRYREFDLQWIHICTRLRATGMPIRGIRRYAELVAAGRGNEEQRLDLIESHQDQVLARIAELQENLKLIAHKVDVYRGRLAAGDADRLWAPARTPADR